MTAAQGSAARGEREGLARWWDWHLAIVHHHTREIPRSQSWALSHAHRWPACQAVPSVTPAARVCPATDPKETT